MGKSTGKPSLLFRISDVLCFLVLVLILIHAVNTLEPTRRAGVLFEMFLIDLLPFFFVLLVWLISRRWPLPGALGLAGMGLMMMYYYNAFPAPVFSKALLNFLGYPLPLFLAAVLIAADQLLKRKGKRHTTPSAA